MALADIINRIDGDGTAEAEELIEAAQRRAEELLAIAREQGERESAAILARAATVAAAEAETVRATARLAARDKLLAAKGELVARALEAAARAVVELPDDAYADLVARRIASASRGGERVLVAADDRARLKRRLPKAVERAAGRDLELVFVDEPAPVERGVVLASRRSTVDLSVVSLIGERRDELAMLAARVLFGTGGATGE